MNELVSIAFRRLIDYAGLFPPASCAFSKALEHYASDRSARYAWIQGPFVLSGKALPQWLADPATRALPVSLVPSSDHLESEIASAINAAERGALRLEAVEVPPVDVARREHVVNVLLNRTTLFFEVPWAEPFEDQLDAIRLIGARAKIRTGGIVATAFPPPQTLARWITACTQRGVSFKATAGLHHALRGDYALTYEPNAARTTMHGFLNLFGAVLAARRGAALRELEAILSAQAHQDLRFEADRAVLFGQSYDHRELEAARVSGFVSFGSCSFEEPVQELQALGILS